MATRPKIALIPSAYKESKLYNILPNNDSYDFSVTRASSATKINKDGLIELVGNNTPRLDYSNGGCPKLLIEKTTTNLLTYSEDISNSNWQKLGLGVATVNLTSNYSLAPDGTLSADRIQLDLNGGTASGDRAIIRQATGAGTAGVFRVFSFYVKSNTGVSQDFNLHTGTEFGTYTATNEWKRIEYAVDNSAITSWGIALKGSLGVSDSVDLLFWGAQVEEGESASSYIETTSAAAVRETDSLELTGVNDLIGNKFTFFVKGKGFDEDSSYANGIIKLHNGVNDIIDIYLETTSDTCVVRFSNPLEDISSAVGDYSNIGVRFDDGVCDVFINGVKYSVTNNQSITSVTTITIDGSSMIKGGSSCIEQLFMYDVALEDSELISLTN